MRYDESMVAVIATAAELAAAARERGLEFSALAPGWLTQATAAEAESGGSQLAPAGTAVLDAALGALVAPARAALAHTMVAGTLIRRMSLSWDAEYDLVVMAGFGPEGVALTAMPAERLYAFLAGSVGLAAPMRASLYRPSLSGRALLALLGCADALRAASMRATLAHVPPSGSVSAEEVAQALADAVTGDVRWLVPFAEGALPFRISDIVQPAEVEAALAELAEAGAITLLAAEDGAPAIAEPTDAGASFLDGLLHENARLAITLAEADEDRIRQETLLLVRSADGLWLADLSASGGAIAGLSRSEADALLRSIAGLAEEAPAAEPEAAGESPAPAPAPTPEPAPAPMPAPAPAHAPAPERVCPACGHVSAPHDQFCRACGTSLG